MDSVVDRSADGNNDWLKYCENLSSPQIQSASSSSSSPTDTVGKKMFSTRFRQKSVLPVTVNQIDLSTLQVTRTLSGPLSSQKDVMSPRLPLSAKELKELREYQVKKLVIEEPTIGRSGSKSIKPFVKEEERKRRELTPRRTYSTADVRLDTITHELRAREMAGKGTVTTEKKEMPVVSKGQERCDDKLNEIFVRLQNQRMYEKKNSSKRFSTSMAEKVYSIRHDDGGSPKLSVRDVVDMCHQLHFYALVGVVTFPLEPSNRLDPGVEENCTLGALVDKLLDLPQTLRAAFEDEKFERSLGELRFKTQQLEAVVEEGKNIQQMMGDSLISQKRLLNFLQSYYAQRVEKAVLHYGKKGLEVKKVTKDNREEVMNEGRERLLSSKIKPERVRHFFHRLNLWDSLQGVSEEVLKDEVAKMVNDPTRVLFEANTNPYNLSQTLFTDAKAIEEHLAKLDPLQLYPELCVRKQAWMDGLRALTPFGKAKERLAVGIKVLVKRTLVVLEKDDKITEETKQKWLAKLDRRLPKGAGKPIHWEGLAELLNDLVALTQLPSESA